MSGAGKTPWGVLLALAVLAAAFALAGLWWWVAFLAVVYLALGAFELLAVRRTGRTLSAQWLEFSRKRPWIGGLLAAALGGFVGYLIYHLATGY